MLDSTGIFSKLINILDLFINHHQTLPLFNFARKKGVGAKGASTKKVHLKKLVVVLKQKSRSFLIGLLPFSTKDVE
jgi:hypothetical protein